MASGKSKVLWFIAAVAVFFVAFRIFPSARAARASEVLDVTRLNANLTDAQQLVIVRTSTDAENAGTLTTYEKDHVTGIWHSVLGPITAHIGRNGFSAAHHEGDGTTPTGIFTLTQMFGRNQDPGVRFPYRQISTQDWWVSDTASPHYNTWQVGPPNGWNPAAGEHLSDSNYAVAYRYATVIDYNRSPVVPGNGSAIFLHVGSKPTSGCVDIAESDLVSVMRWLDPTKKPQILMGSDNTLLAPDRAPDVTALLSPAPVGFAAVTPHRVLDTRTGLGHAGPLGPGQTLDLPVTTDPQLGDATAVVLNLTIVGPTQPTYLEAYPTPAGAEPAPTFSSLNAAAGDQQAGLVIVRVGAGGSVRIGNYAGTTHVVADVVGFASPTQGTRLLPITPYRALDTRLGQGADGNATPLGPGQWIDVALPYVPAGATAVVVNVTATGASEPTFVAALPGFTPWDGTSTVNVPSKLPTPNLAIVPLGQIDPTSPLNTIRIYNHSGTTDVIADVAGFLMRGGDAVDFVPADQPTRVLDTRRGLGVRGNVGALGTIDLVIPGLPDSATAVALTLTGDRMSTPTNVRAYPTGPTDVPIISNLNLEPGPARANTVIVKVGPDHHVRLFNQAGHVDLVVDVVGWFRN